MDKDSKSFFPNTSRKTTDVNEPAQNKLFCSREGPHLAFKLFSVTSITNTIHIKVYLQTVITALSSKYSNLCFLFIEHLA